jgi:hypothetical protein
MEREYYQLAGTGFARSFIFILLLFLLPCCNVTSQKVVSHKSFSGAPTPDWVYEPEFYTYKNGRYTFVKGHYRKVLSRKNYWKRSLRGFGSRNDYAVAR